MMIRTLAWLATVVFVAACERDQEPEDAPPLETPDTAAAATAPGGGAPADEARARTVVEGTPTAATTAAEIGAPEPPGGYAVDSKPASGERLAKIEFATPQTVPEAAQYYDTQMQSTRRVELDVAGDNVIVYALSPSSKITPATTIQDVEQMLDEASEPMVVIGPWTLNRNDSLIRDLRAAGQNAQADALIQTRSKVTVIYSVR